MLLLAVYISPSIAGTYTLAILGLTFFQAATDNAIRQHAVLSITTTSGLQFLQSYRIYTSIIGLISILIFQIAMYAFLPTDLRSQVILLLPLALIPAISALRVIAVAQLQFMQKWKLLANIQLVSALISLAVSVPLLILTKSLLATTVQAVGTELMFTTLVFLKSKNANVPVAHQLHDEARSEFFHLSLYSTVAWMQSQADRLLMGPIAGIGQLGLYSVATSISRSAGDAISTSTANVLRPKLLNTHLSNVDKISTLANQTLIKALPIAMSASLATMMGTQLLLKPFLDQRWQPALDCAIVLSLSTIPTLLAWSTTVTLLACQRIRWAGPIKALGILLAVPIAISANRSLIAAASLSVLREIAILLLLTVVAGKFAPRRSVAIGSFMMLILALVAAGLVSLN